MKIAPLIRAFNKNGNYKFSWYIPASTTTKKKSKLFFDELQISKPDINLEVGSESHTVQTAETMKRFEPVLEDF